MQLLASIWAELGLTQLKLVLKLYCGVIVRTVAQSQSGYHSPSMHTVMILWFDLTFKWDRLGMWTKQICIPQNAKWTFYTFWGFCFNCIETTFAVCLDTLLYVLNCLHSQNWNALSQIGLGIILWYAFLGAKITNLCVTRDNWLPCVACHASILSWLFPRKRHF